MEHRKLLNEELNRLSVDDYKKVKKFPIIIILDNVRSLSNIGSIFRTSDAFRLEKIILSGISATPPHREIHKTALGAEESVDWEYYKNPVDAVEKLIEAGYHVFSVEQAENSVSLENFSIEKEKKYAFVFGNEVNGVLQEIINLSQGCIEIPQFGTKHSFNISVSVGIVLWQILKPQ